MLKIGDFVTQYSAGYWQIIDIKDKIANDDYSDPDRNISWKKGDVLGKWIIMKKAFTPKMKPRIAFEYCDSYWVKPVSENVLNEINACFEADPKFKAKFDSAPAVLLPSITNCWLDLPTECEASFCELMRDLPRNYTMEEFWQCFKDYKKHIVANPPCGYILNFLTYPWNLDANQDLIYFDCHLEKIS